MRLWQRSRSLMEHEKLAALQRYTCLQKRKIVKSLPRCLEEKKEGGGSLDRPMAGETKCRGIHDGSKEIEEKNMFWWIVDLFLDRDWSDLVGLVALIALLVALAILLAAN